MAEAQQRWDACEGKKRLPEPLKLAQTVRGTQKAEGKGVSNVQRHTGRLPADTRS
jgi:hypothetical protein